MGLELSILGGNLLVGAVLCDYSLLTRVVDGIDGRGTAYKRENLGVRRRGGDRDDTSSICTSRQ